MVWRQGASDDELEAQAQRPPPWRAAAPTTPSTAPSAVVVEAWDDEVPRPSRSDEVADGLRRTRERLGPGARHAGSLLLFAGAVLGAIAGFLVAWMHLLNDPLADATAYYEAAARLNAGEPLYPAGIDPNGNRIYLYPPLLAHLLRPLALLGFPVFAAVWEGVIVLSFVLLLRYLGVRRPSTWMAVGLLGIPIGWALTVAQAHVPFTLLLAFGQPWSIAIAANLKLTPVLIALWWLGRRDRQALFAFAAWMALLALAQIVVDAESALAFFSNVGVEQLGEVRNWSPFVQSPVLWAVLVGAGALLTLALARTRWGWPAAVTLVTLSPPRLLVYMFMGLLAALRQPADARNPDLEDEGATDPASAYAGSAR
jgi:hypothetical protein